MFQDRRLWKVSGKVNGERVEETHSFTPGESTDRERARAVLVFAGRYPLAREIRTEQIPAATENETA